MVSLEHPNAGKFAAHGELEISAHLQIHNLAADGGDQSRKVFARKAVAGFSQLHNMFLDDEFADGPECFGGFMNHIIEKLSGNANVAA